MKTLLFTNEYPPQIYGGAGVHVDYLTRELVKLMQVEVRCFGDQKEHHKNLSVRGFDLGDAITKYPELLQSPLGAARRCVDFNGAGVKADLVHCHTWYTYLGGIIAKLIYGVPLVVTVHSLEPLRPWKREQLGGGYDFSCWVEKVTLEMADAIIAVSSETKRDVLACFDVPEERVSVIYNGIDLEEYRENKNPEFLDKLGIDSARPYLLFVGRVTRQKGIMHLLRAIKKLDTSFQIVLCASSADTPEIAAEVEAAINKVREYRQDIVWIRGMIDRKEIIALYSGASVFVCPSIYEPFGIINLEAMACGIPVVATAVGGIKEVVIDEITGFLVPFEKVTENLSEEKAEELFHDVLASRINQLMGDPALRARMGAAGRLRVERHFGWSAIAQKTEALYQNVLSGKVKS